jgi:hypothetical protein
MAPYRSHREDRPKTAPKGGLVADMVRQFADPYAFLRELVQNGIDAGATAIDIRIDRGDGASLPTTTTVIDDGCGMSLEVMEGPLLTLFSSSKEGDLTKIGKYGVGFISVFALEPEEVEVVTFRDGRAYLLRLYVDHRYAIEEAPPRPGSGTRVTLVKRMEEAAFKVHVEQARTALRRWCRHAERPIHLLVPGPLGEALPTRTRVDVPFTVAAAITVTATIEDETFVVGPSAGAHLVAPPPPGEAAGPEYSETFAGFYNRGLTLFETTSSVHRELAGIRFKVKSPRLSHTLSRDDVRRDEAFTRVVSRVRELCSDKLRRALIGELARAAARAAGWEEVSAYVALLTAALAPSPLLSLKPGEITFPLTDPIKGASALAFPLSAFPGHRAPLFAVSSSPITAALAERGQPVIRLVDPKILSALERCFPASIAEDAQRAYFLIRELDAARLGEGDRALCAQIQRVFAAAGAEVASVSLGEIEGGSERRTAVLLSAERSPSPTARVCSVEAMEAAFRRWNRRHQMVLNGKSEAVVRARKLAEKAPSIAAHLLGRALLVEGRGPLDPSDNARLLELAGEALG